MKGSGYLEGSLILGSCKRLLALLLQVWLSSRSYDLMLSLGHKLSACAGGSAAVKFIKRQGFLSAACEESRFAGFFAIALDFVPQKIVKPIVIPSKVIKSSYIVKGLKLASDNLHFFVSVFLAGMLLMPHAFWNNLFATATLSILMVLLIFRESTKEGLHHAVKKLGSYYLLFILLVVLAFVTSVSIQLSFRFLMFHLTSFMLVIILVGGIRSFDELITSIEVVLCAVTLSAVYGIFQGLRGVPVNAAEIDITLNDTATGRIYGFFDNPNNFGQVLILFLPLFIALILMSTGWKKRAFYAIAAIPPLIALILTLSRSSWIGLAVALFVFAIFFDWRFIPLAAIAALIAYPILPMSIQQRIMSMFNPADTSTRYRTVIFNTIWPVIRDYWWTGLGLGNDAVMKITRNYPIFSVAVPLHSHNLFLQVWVETGIIGLAAFVGFLGQTFKRAMKCVYRAKRKSPGWYLLVAGVASLSGILVTAFAEYIWFYPRVMLSFWAVAGILLSAVVLSEAEASSRESECKQEKTG